MSGMDRGQRTPGFLLPFPIQNICATLWTPSLSAIAPEQRPEGPIFSAVSQEAVTCTLDFLYTEHFVHSHLSDN
jgi:hypothetical protein